jgi:hypothetical protein
MTIWQRATVPSMHCASFSFAYFWTSPETGGWNNVRN